MKTNTIILTIAAAVLSLASCEQKKEPAGELKEKIDDALDRRPNEKLKDSIEDLEKDARKAGEGISDALDKAAQDVEKKVDKSK